MSMNKDDGTARNVRELIRLGKLPPHPPTRVWAGYGPGSDPCAICATLVPADQVIMEAVFGTDDGKSLFFHRECFHVAESEWRRFQGASTSASAAERALSAIVGDGRRADSAAGTK
jgi:hypothetical protein